MALELGCLSKACSLQNLIPRGKMLMISKNHQPQSTQIWTTFRFVHLQVPKQTLVSSHPFFAHPLSQLMDEKDPKHITSHLHPSPLLHWHLSPTLPLLNLYHSFSTGFKSAQLTRADYVSLCDIPCIHPVIVPLLGLLPHVHLFNKK